MSIALWAAAGCSKAPSGVGASCATDETCESALCFMGRCTASDSDVDGDGLSIARELRLGTNPLDPDSDRDGRPDGLEVGAGDLPLDTDGDGNIDALESGIASSGGGCLPDEHDPSDGKATLAAHLAQRGCSTLGVCATTTTATCVLGHVACLVSDSRYEAGTETRCDGLDNDCDGLTDEALAWRGLSLGEACQADGVCGLGHVECDASLGTTQCSTAPGGSHSAASPERCNGLDDDCDGDTDEDLRLGMDSAGQALGAPCTSAGVCGVGRVECGKGTSDIPVCSADPAGSAYVGVPELCNQLDDDCDGQTDEDFTFTDAAGTLYAIGASCGVGRCQGGKVLCADTLLSATCSSPLSPLPDELCNGEDDDCDGTVDDPPIAPVAGTCPTAGVCASAGVLVAACKDGAWTCVAAPNGDYEAVSETRCDGKDNDCDGATDESASYFDPLAGTANGVGTPCGTGVCAGGHVVCSLDGKGALCSTAQLAGDESCNGQDDDCDGTSDEELQWSGLALGAPCDGVGACGKGTVVCATTGVATCSTNADAPGSQAVKETCNGQDDDCDGLTDESTEVLLDVAACLGPGVCQNAGGVPKACTDGVLTCDRSAVSGYEPGTETTCDGKDNDCDQLIDEGLPKKPTKAWNLVSAGSPPPRLETVAAYDPASGTVIVTGGRTLEGPLDQPALLGDTWQLRTDSGTWDAKGGKVTPVRGGATLIADPPGERLVLFGGTAAPNGEPPSPTAEIVTLTVGEWTWTPMPTLGKVAPRSDHAAVFDPTNRWMWVIGGTGSGPGSAVAALDLASGQWLPSLPQGPGWRHAPAAAFVPAEGSSPARIVVFGGRSGVDGTTLGDTWLLALGASGWTPHAQPLSPPPRSEHRMVSGKTGVWMFGGVDGKGQVLGDLWRFDPSALTWEPLPLPPGSPAARRSPGLVRTDAGVLLLGGASQTDALSDAWWLSEGTTPSFVPLASALVTPRLEALIAGSWAARLWVYGGVRRDLSAPVPLGDAWVRDATTGGGFGLVSSAGPARLDPALAFDAAGDRVLVHGGRTAAGAPPTSTLHWLQGSTWTTVETSVALVEHASAWDPISARVIVHGGVGADDTPRLDTWSLSTAGAVEKLTLTSGAPVPRRGGVAIHDSTGPRLILVGGEGSGGAIATLSLDERVYETVVTIPALATRRPVTAYEPASGRLLVGVAGPPAQFWLVDLVAKSAQPQPFFALPNALAGTATLYDSAMGMALTFGGSDASAHGRNVLWSLDWSCAP